MILWMFIEPCTLILENTVGGVLMVHREVGLIFFLISEQLGLDIASADITPGYCSDHSLVDIAFKTNIVKRNNLFFGVQFSLIW